MTADLGVGALHPASLLRRLTQYLRQLCRIELRLGRMDPAQLRDLLEQLRH